MLCSVAPGLTADRAAADGLIAPILAVERGRRSRPCLVASRELDARALDAEARAQRDRDELRRNILGEIIVGLGIFGEPGTDARGSLTIWLDRKESVASQLCPVHFLDTKQRNGQESASSPIYK